MIDKSFRELKYQTLEQSVPIKTKLNRDQLNQIAIKDLYDREDNIQKSIFYYNNEILNRMVKKIVKRPLKHKNPLEREDES
jgi:hypothetical protein